VNESLGLAFLVYDFLLYCIYKYERYAIGSVTPLVENVRNSHYLTASIVGLPGKQKGDANI